MSIAGPAVSGQRAGVAYVLNARQQTATQGIHDLVGKRVMLEPQSDELLAYLQRKDIPFDRIIRVEHGYDTQDLISGKTDAMALCHQPAARS